MIVRFFKSFYRLEEQRSFDAVFCRTAFLSVSVGFCKPCQAIFSRSASPVGQALSLHPTTGAYAKIRFGSQSVWRGGDTVAPSIRQENLFNPDNRFLFSRSRKISGVTLLMSSEPYSWLRGQCFGHHIRICFAISARLFASFKSLNIASWLTVLSILVSSRLVFRKPAVLPRVVAEFPVNKVVTVLALGKLSVFIRRPFHMLLFAPRCAEGFGL